MRYWKRYLMAQPTQLRVGGNRVPGSGRAVDAARSSGARAATGRGDWAVPTGSCKVLGADLVGSCVCKGFERGVNGQLLDE